MAPSETAKSSVRTTSRRGVEKEDSLPSLTLRYRQKDSRAWSFHPPCQHEQTHARNVDSRSEALSGATDRKSADFLVLDVCEPDQHLEKLCKEQSSLARASSRHRGRLRHPDCVSRAVDEVSETADNVAAEWLVLMIMRISITSETSTGSSVRMQPESMWAASMHAGRQL
eukprot:3608533-Rhodomonas_salina.3